MSRSGYVDEGQTWEWVRWRGAVTSALRGRRGQAFLRELLSALDSLEHKRLIDDDLSHDGEVCALGAVGVRRGLPLETIDPHDPDSVAGAFGIATAMAREIADVNDEGLGASATPERRWQMVRAWVIDNLVTQPEEAE